MDEVVRRARIPPNRRGVSVRRSTCRSPLIAASCWTGGDGRAAAPEVRQQLVEPLVRMGVHPDAHVGKVLERVHAVRLAGRDQRAAPGQVLAGPAAESAGTCMEGGRK